MMAGYLPDGCTQGMIDDHYGDRDAPGWTCEDPDCREKWAEGDVETWPCQADGCDVIGCPSCHVVCYFCDRAICSLHRVKYIDDEQHWVCAPCKAIAEARDREEGRQVRRAN